MPPSSPLADPESILLKVIQEQNIVDPATGEEIIGVMHQFCAQTECCRCLGALDHERHAANRRRSRGAVRASNPRSNSDALE